MTKTLSKHLLALIIIGTLYGCETTSEMLARTTDQATLKKYAVEGESSYVRDIAIDKIHDQAFLEKFVGRYESGKSNIFEVSMADKILTIFAVDFEYTTGILPESALVFFDERDGRKINFSLDENNLWSFQ